MDIWREIKTYLAEHLVRQADNYLWDFHKRFNHSADDAIAKCRQAIRLKPNYAEAYLVYANALNNKGEVEQAIIYYKKAIIIDPALYYAYINLAELLSHRGEALKEENNIEISREYLAEALSMYRTAFALREGDWRERSGFAETLQLAGDWKGAISEYQAALLGDPDHPFLQMHLGLCQLEHEQYLDALETFRKYLINNPHDTDIHYWLAETLVALDRIEEAIGEYRTAERHIEAGELLLMENKREEAINEFSVSIDKAQQNNELAHYYLGKLLLNSDEKELSISHLQNFLVKIKQKDPAFFEVDEDRRRKYDEKISEVEKLIPNINRQSSS